MFEKKLLKIFDELITMSEKIQKEVNSECMDLANYIDEFATINLHLPRRAGKTYALLHLAKVRFNEDCIILSNNERHKKELIERCKEFGYKELSHNIFNINSMQSLQGVSHKKAVLIDSYANTSIDMQYVYRNTIPLFTGKPYFYIIVS